MPKFDELAADDPKDSADDMESINKGSEDHSQSIPSDDDAGGGPSVADAFRSGS
ncbi:MAG: hypothetical protein M3N53_14790 [Actinomycetota bacterium]|nr:hypothetical protein [Actinomycetota bacterium]